MNDGTGPSIGWETEDGQKVMFPLRWDPRDPASSGRPPGPLDEVLAALDADLVEEESAETLAAKCLVLAQLGKPEEQQVESARRLLQVVARKGEDLSHQLAWGRFFIATALASPCHRYAEAAQAYSDVTAFYGANDDPFLRGVAIWAISERIVALGRLGDLDAVAAAWESVRVDYGAETDPALRNRVAAAGRHAAVGLLNVQRRRDALRTANEVRSLYQSDTDAMTRAQVIAAMMVRFSALPRWRFLSRGQAAKDLLHFIGSNPEPEVVDAAREVHPGLAELFLRRAHDLYRHAV